MNRADKAILLFTMLVFWSPLLLAQKPPSVEEQLRAQYESGTALTVQKQGVFAVAPTGSKICPVKYQDGKLNPAEASCLGSLTVGTRVLAVGEKINPAEIDVDVAKERISFHLVECDSCNKGMQSASFKSQIDFQFAKGYLEQAGVSQIVDTISEVLAFPDVAVEEPPPPPPGPSDQPGQDGTLTNSGVMRMSKAHLGDGIIISKIKASACNFDTSVDALVKLKEAGVSDPVIQAMQDASPPDGNPANVSGHWISKFSDSGGSGDVEVDLAQQPDGSVTGSSRYHGTVIATIQGTLQGNTLTYTSTQTTPQCPGTFSGTISFDGDTGRGRYEGNDCRGNIQNGTLTGSRAADGGSPSPTPGTLTFSFRHRHRLMNSSWQIVDYYCSGTLSVSKDGTVAYECTQTDIPSGRCEKPLSFAPGSLKEVKVTSGGNLHLASKKQGNFDFKGNPDDIQQAQAAIAQSLQTAQK